jgi:L-cystine uptake protein TcyP (sodium:dicarboxylate symporter family)
MIKFIISVIIILALIGGAVQFVSTSESWALSSVQNGITAIYEFIKELIADADQIKGVDLSVEK